MKKVVLLGMLCAGAHGVFGMEGNRQHHEALQDDAGTKKAHTDDNEQVRLLVFKSLEDPAEDIKSLVLKIRERLKKALQLKDIEDLALDDIAHNVHLQEWHKFLVSKLGWSDLHIPAATGQLEMIESLLDRGAVIEARDKTGCTSLHWAAGSGHVGAIELLLDRGAVIEARDDEDATPLHWAARAGQVETISFLLDRGARIEAPDGGCMTPLHVAAGESQVGAIGCLLDRGAEIEAQEYTGMTPLHFASARGQIRAIELLLDRGAAIEARDNSGMTPLHWAAYCGQVGAIGLLLDRGAVIEARANDGKTPLMVLARGKHFDCAREFISHGCFIPEPESQEFLTKARKEMTMLMLIFKKRLKWMPKELWLHIVSFVKDSEENNLLFPLLLEEFRKRGYRGIPLVLRAILAEHLRGYTLEKLPKVMEEAREKSRSDEMRALLDPKSLERYESVLLQTIRKRCGVFI